LRLLTTKIKVDINFKTKTKKQKWFSYFVDALRIFFLAEYLLFEWQTDTQKINNYPRIKNTVRRAATIRLLSRLHTESGYGLRTGLWPASVFPHAERTPSPTTTDIQLT